MRRQVVAIWRKFLIPCSWALFVSITNVSCVTLKDTEQTADGQRIPGKMLFNFFEYEHVCELTMNRDYQELEQLLDRYGRNGWKLAGFMNKNGDTYAFCMVR